MNRNIELVRLYETSSDMYIKRMYYRTKNILDAEDIVQDAFERALRYYDSYSSRGDGNLTAWFETVLTNAQNDHMRNQRRLGMTTEYDEELDTPVEMDEWGEDMIKRVKALLVTKNPEVRSVLQLYFFSEYKPREIGNVVELSPANIRKIIERFKKELREGYEKDMRS